MQTKFSDGSIGVCGILPRDAEEVPEAGETDA